MFIFKSFSNVRLFRVLFPISASVFFYKAIIELVFRWFENGSYYNQGPLVVVLFFWVLVKRFQSWKGYSGSNYIAGIFFITLSITAEIFGSYASILTFRFFAVYLFITGCSLLFLDKKFVYHNWMLFLYLLLAIPLPSFLLDYITLELKLSSASISGFILSAFYPSTSLYGSTLYVDNFFIEVTPACSGMENIFGMISLVWFFALFQKQKLIMWLDVILAIPAAITANILRITLVSIITVNGFGDFAFGIFHKVIGLVIFLIIFIMIIMFNEWPRFNAAGDDKKTEVPIYYDNNKKMVTLTFIMLILAAISISAQFYSLNGEGEIAPLLKNSLKTETSDWISRDEKLEESYYNMLGTDDIMMREYYKKNNYFSDRSVYLYFVHARGNRTPFLHRPELCLQGEGYNLYDKKDIELQKTGITVTRMLFVRGREGLLVYYWYICNGKELNSFLKLQWKMFTDIEKNLDCSMIRISRVVDPANVEEGEILLREFAESGIHEITGSLIK